MTRYFIIIAIPCLVVLASLVWVIVAATRRGPSLKAATVTIGIETLIIVALYFHWFAPKDYPRNYLDRNRTESAGLGALATARGFYIGGAVNSATNPVLAELVPSEFNSLTPENATKWRQLLVDGKIGKYDFSKADAIVDFALSRSVRVRGHTLVWGKFPGRTYPKALDERIANASDPTAELLQIMGDHILTVMTHFKGRISTWDVVNEPMSMDGPYLDENIYLNTLGKRYIAEAFRMAHAADPSVQLFLNEQFGSYTGEGVEVFFDLLKWLLEEKVPIHGVGIQAHNIFRTHELDEFRAFVGRVSDLGLKFEVTEFDARIRLFNKAKDPYKAQSDYIAEYARICIEHPACSGFTFWGLSDESTWFDHFPPFKWMLPNDPLLFDSNRHPKAAYFEILDTLKSKNTD